MVRFPSDGVIGISRPLASLNVLGAARSYPDGAQVSYVTPQSSDPEGHELLGGSFVKDGRYVPDAVAERISYLKTKVFKG